MNILVLTGKFGMGHLSTATAILEEIKANYPQAQVDVVDFIDYLFPAYSNAIYRGFNFLVRHCSCVYNGLNSVASRHSSVPLKSVALNKMVRLLDEYKADLVISTLPICSQYTSAFKEMTGCHIPLYTYITDIKVQKEWISKNTDLYFVGASCTKNILISKGVGAEKVIISGIPVRQKFRCCDSLQRPQTAKKEILVIGGGLGLIPSTNHFLGELCEKKDVHITMITGKNQKLMQQMKERFPSVDVISYTTEVHTYMKNADIIITKSGGITTFEAINVGTPLYILKPFLSQEVGNAEYVEQQNIGRVIWSNHTDIANDIWSLLQNPLLLKTMRNNMRLIREAWATCSPVFYVHPHLLLPQQ